MESARSFELRHAGWSLLAAFWIWFDGIVGAFVLASAATSVAYRRTYVPLDRVGACFFLLVTLTLITFLFVWWATRFEPSAEGAPGAHKPLRWSRGFYTFDRPAAARVRAAREMAERFSPAANLRRLF